MTTDELLQLFTGEKAYRQLAAEIRPGRSVGLASLAGSSLSLVAAAAVWQTGGLHVFVMEDRDAAGYLYNDLFPLLGEERLLFFPTGYKRSIQFGQEDPSGIVQRTAALNAVKNNDGGAFFGVGDSVFSAAGFCGQEAVRTAQYETQPRYAAA